MTFTSTHRLIQNAASNLEELPDESVQLVVTSPPYPMISMWDEQFILQSPPIQKALNDNNGIQAFELMHQVLDKVWTEMYRLIQKGGFLCINIGDAARTLNENFCLYSNHSRITNACINIGFQNLPNIIWRKATNAPNKYMGSGMYPAGAYVTLEHEHILIFRKGGKRRFADEKEIIRRRKSALFWDERNLWFSDLWQLKGASQNMNIQEGRDRSAAYPFEIPFRLINMYSLQEETILDPFSGSGTSSIAAMSCGRNSIGVDLEPTLIQFARNRITQFLHEQPNAYQMNRLKQHVLQVKSSNPEFYGYKNRFYGFPVKTRQEKDLILAGIRSFDFKEDIFILTHIELFDPEGWCPVMGDR